MQKKIAYQGVQGAYSEQACNNAYKHYTTVACDTFHEAMWMVESGDSDLAMIPLENSTAGRVEEIYRLIPKMALHVIGEHFEPVVHCLLALPHAKLEELKYVASHPQALAQCHNNIIELGLKAEAKLDTAGAAKELLELQDMRNTTRFFILSSERNTPVYDASQSYITSLIFQVKNIPAALYKVLGGFATNGVNILKIESYMGTNMLQGSQFHIDIEGHIDANNVKLALDELAFFADEVRILGTYKSHRHRRAEN